MFFWPFFGAFMIVKIVVALILLAFIIWMAVDCIQRKFKVEAEKWIWIVLMIITGWIGAVLYYIFVRSLNPKGVAKK